MIFHETLISYLFFKQHSYIWYDLSNLGQITLIQIGGESRTVGS